MVTPEPMRVTGPSMGRIISPLRTAAASGAAMISQTSCLRHF